MINTLVAKVFGTKNEREIKRLMPRVEAINALEPAMQKLSDDATARQDRRIPRAHPGAPRHYRR